MSSFSSITAPTPRREEDNFVFAGDVKERENNGPDLSLLLSPPVGVKDPYGWMRDEKRENVEILKHIENENKYTEKITEHLQALRTTLYNEMLSFIQETDYTSPKKYRDYLYFERTFEGKSYKVHCRAPHSSLPSGPIQWSGSKDEEILKDEIVLLDENVLAEGLDYCSVGEGKLFPACVRG